MAVTKMLSWLIEQKPDVRVKIAPLPGFGCSVKLLQRPIPHHNINFCSQ